MLLSFSKFVTEIYSEPDDSSFTDNGHTYDLNGLLSATLGMRQQDFLVSELIWIFKYDNPFREPSRIEHANLDTPILVTNENGALVVLDGLHRLEKAVEEKQKTIKGILFPDELLQRYKIS